MIPRDPEVPAWVNAVLWVAVVGLFVLMLFAAGCCCAPRVVPAPMPAPPLVVESWDAYVRTRPWARDLDPAVAHPAWRGVGTACGAGKCE